MRLVRPALALAALASAPAAAPAQIRYAWADLAGTPVMSAAITGVGGTVTLRVYVRDTAAGAPVFNSQGGLGSAGVRVTGAAGGVGATGGTPDVGDGGWQLGDTNSSNPPANVALNLFNTSAGRLPDATGRVLLGTVTLRGDALGTFEVTAGDPNPTSGTDITLFNNGQGLDFPELTTLQVLVAPVPEPAGLIVVVGAAAACVGRVRRALT